MSFLSLCLSLSASLSLSLCLTLSLSLPLSLSLCLPLSLCLYLSLSLSLSLSLALMDFDLVPLDKDSSFGSQPLIWPLPLSRTRQCLSIRLVGTHAAF